jgi:hypothetical protein
MIAGEACLGAKIINSGKAGERYALDRAQCPSGIKACAHREPITSSNPTNRPNRATDFGISSVELRVCQEVFGELPSIPLPPILHIQLTIRASAS